MKCFATRLAALFVILSFCILPGIAGAKGDEKSPPPQTMSGYIWKILLKLKPRSGDSYYRVTAVIGVRGFSTALPYEKSAFRFGALAAELQYAENARDEERAKKTSALIMGGLKQADVLVTSGEESLPMEKLTPAIETFVKEKKLDDFYQFGQWVGSLHLALLTTREGNMEVASELLGKDSQAGYFLNLLKDRDVLPGVINNLKKLERMKNKTVYAERDVKEAISYLENIILLMG
jgi:hypothetical protein